MNQKYIELAGCLNYNILMNNSYNPQMKKYVVYGTDHTIIVDEENLRFLHRFLKQYYSHIKYSCKCIDKTPISFDTFKELLQYENPTFKKITQISIYGYNNPNNNHPDLEIVLGTNNWYEPVASYTLNTNMSDVPKFENELQARIKELRPWYWILLYTIHLLGFVLPSLLFLQVLRPGNIISIWNIRSLDIIALLFNIISLGTYIISLGVISLLSFYIYIKYIKARITYFFPETTIKLGRQKKNSERRNIIKNVISSFISIIFNTSIAYILTLILEKLLWQ